MSSVQLWESRGSSAQQGKDAFCRHIMCRMWKPPIVLMSTSESKYSLLEAPGVSVWRSKPHVFVVAGASLHPGNFCISVSHVSLCLCVLGISEDVPWPSLHHGHLCISPSWASASWHLPIPDVEAARQETRGAAPSAQLECCRVPARAAESSTSQMLPPLSKSLAASFS